MKTLSWRKAALMAAVVPMLALSACSSTGGKPVDAGSNAGSGQVATTDRIKIALITHAAPGDTFWDILRKGAEEASAKDNVELLYTSDPEGGRQAQLIQQAIDQKVDGIAVTLAKPDALKDVLKKARTRASPSSASTPAPTSGTTSARSPTSVRTRTSPAPLWETNSSSLGVKRPICVIMEQGNVALDSRCAGVKSKIPATENLFVQGTDMTQVSSTVTAKLQATPDADAIIGLGAPFTLTIDKAVEALNLQEQGQGGLLRHER